MQVANIVLAHKATKPQPPMSLLQGAECAQRGTPARRNQPPCTTAQTCASARASPSRSTTEAKRAMAADESAASRTLGTNTVKRWHWIARCVQYRSSLWGPASSSRTRVSSVSTNSESTSAHQRHNASSDSNAGGCRHSQRRDTFKARKSHPAGNDPLRTCHSCGDIPRPSNGS